ncbi:unnamed protein product [Symbiodinium sp. CCMP2456]|nr:unnamed protein product [Symbiodinium sp. CCMP2456]
MDLCEAFSDDEAPVGAELALPATGTEDGQVDLLAAFSDEDDRVQAVDDAALVPLEPRADDKSEPSFKGYSLKGKVGRGRHGDQIERNLVCAHMRAEKRARKNRENEIEIIQALQDSCISKNGSTFNIAAKTSSSGGIQIILHKTSGRGNRFVRKIHFSKFIRASFGPNSSGSNVALALLLQVDGSTIPRLQKTCAGTFMVSQAKMLAKLYAYCQRCPPLTVHHHIKFDETCVSTTLSPGGQAASVKSQWSTLVVRSRLRVTWSSGAVWEMRLVTPVVPLLSSSAEQVYYALRNHPSYHMLNNLIRMVGTTATVRCTLFEVDGAYANVLYGLAVFARNLGYLLRLQLAVKDNLIVQAEQGQPVDQLMQETIQFLEQWHHGRDCEDSYEQGRATRQSEFHRKLESFKNMWNGSFAGQPMHRCTLGHCTDREDIIEKMTQSFVSLMLAVLPAVPAPNKWTTIWPSSDFVGLGLLIHNYLPSIFELAFRPVMFTTDMQHEETDPRLVEGLHFQAVQGKRYVGSRDFLANPDSQWNCRVWLLVSEHLRRLVFYWLRNLKDCKKAGSRFPICELLDKRASVVWAVLQNIGHQLLDNQGTGRLCFAWQASGFSSYQEWCSCDTKQVRELRRALLALSAWVFRRHIVYWEQFPWCLMRLVDDAAEEASVQAVKDRWDSSLICCMPAGLARELKRAAPQAEALVADSKWRATLTGFAALLQMTIADVETKHALSRHWADRPFPTILCIDEATAITESARPSAPLESDSAVARGPTKGAAIKIKTPQIRSKSAYMYFRDDFLRVQKDIMAGGTINPCTTEFWQELKAAWAALPPARRDYYEELALQSKIEADRVRSAPRSETANDAVVPQQQPVVATGHQRESNGELQPLSFAGSEHKPGTPAAIPYNPWVLASSATSDVEIPDLAERVRQCMQSQSSSSVDLSDECMRLSPVSEDQLQASWRHQVTRGVTWAAALKQFNRESQRFAVPSTDDLFPERVMYQSSCGCLCRTLTSGVDCMFFERLLAAFNEVVTQCGNGCIAAASKCDILLRHDLHFDDMRDPCPAFYTWVTAVSARSGPHASSQVFVQCRVVQGPTAEEGQVRLQLDSLPSIGSQLRWCSSLLVSGPLRHYTEQEFAKLLLEQCLEFGAVAVGMTRLQFDDVDVATVKTAGTWPAWKDILVPASSQPLPEEAQADPGVLEPPAEPVVAAQSFDLISEVAGDVPARGRGRGGGRGRGRGKETTKQIRNRLIASMPVDNNLDEALDAELHQLLSEQNILPPEADVLGSAADLHDAVQDPTVVACLDENFAGEVIDAVHGCREVNPEPRVAFQESDDDEIVEDNLDQELGIDVSEAVGGEASVAGESIPQDAWAGVFSRSCSEWRCIATWLTRLRSGFSVGL